MSEYPLAPLEEVVAEAIPGFASGDRDSEGIIQIRMNNVSTDGKLLLENITRVPKSQKNISRYHLTEGDVLFNSTNSPKLVGKTTVFRKHCEPVVFSNHFLRLRVKSDKLDPSYLARWLTMQWQQNVFEGMCTQWVNQASVKKERLLGLTIPLPPLTEQRRIAAILDKADSLRIKRQAIIVKLNELLESVFIDMFGDPVANQKKFQTRKLSTHIHIKGGFAFKSTNYVDKGIPLIRIGEVNRRQIDVASAKFLPIEFLKSHQRFVISPGDLLMSLTGTTGKDDYANVWLLNNAYERCFLNQRVAHIQPDESVLTREFLFHLFKNEKIKAQITRKSRGVRQANISNDDILELVVPIPPIELQRQFSSFATKLKRVRTSQEQAHRKSESLFISTQQRAFTGELFPEESATSTQPLLEVSLHV